MVFLQQGKGGTVQVLTKPLVLGFLAGSVITHLIWIGLLVFVTYTADPSPLLP